MWSQAFGPYRVSIKFHFLHHLISLREAVWPVTEWVISSSSNLINHIKRLWSLLQTVPDRNVHYHTGIFMEIKGNDSCINKQIPNQTLPVHIRWEWTWLIAITMDPKIMWVGKTRYKHIIDPNNSQLAKIIIKLTFPRKNIRNVHKINFTYSKYIYIYIYISYYYCSLSIIVVL